MALQIVFLDVFEQTLNRTDRHKAELSHFENSEIFWNREAEKTTCDNSMVVLKTLRYFGTEAEKKT